MWGLSSYDDCVQVLYNRLETLLTTAATTLALCHRMIESEEKIRQDVHQLKSIYDESCEQLMSSVREFADFMGVVQQMPETDLGERRKKARSMDEFLKKEYHNVPKKEFKKYVFLELMRKGKNDGLTEEETYLFHDDHEKVHKVRKAIEHFDEMGVEGQQGKLDSTTIVFFLKWCAVEKGKEKRMYQYFCDNYKGRYKLLVWSAVSKTRKEQRELGITERGAADSFQKMMESIDKEVAVV
jgi:hypothetical protein